MAAVTEAEAGVDGGGVDGPGQLGACDGTADEDQLETFDPFVSDPVFLGRLKPWSTQPWRIGLVVSAVGLGSLLVVNAVQGTVGTFSWEQLRADVRAGFFGDRTELALDRRYDLLRDLPSVIAALVAFLTPALTAYQWHAMGEYVRRLYRSGLLYSPDCTRAWYREQIERENRAMARLGSWSGAALAVSLVLATLITRAQISVGVFGAIGGRSDEYAIRAYDQWWAGQSTNFAGFVLYFVITAFFLYLVLMQNAVGIRLVYFMLRTRRHLYVGYDLYNVDGVYGWLPMRRLLWTVYSSLAAHALAIIVLAFTVQPDAFLRWLLPITALYLGVFPLYVVLPLWLFARRRRVRKDEGIADLARRLQAAHPGPVRRIDRPEPDVRSLLEAPLLQWQLRETRHVALTPFRTREVVVGVALYVAPAAAAVFAGFGILD